MNNRFLFFHIHFEETPYTQSTYAWVFWNGILGDKSRYKAEKNLKLLTSLLATQVCKKGCWGLNLRLAHAKQTVSYISMTSEVTIIIKKNLFGNFPEIITICLIGLRPCLNNKPVTSKPDSDENKQWLKNSQCHFTHQLYWI